jgi:methylated-DNA-[protein]-cysteine S-methyltransferase
MINSVTKIYGRYLRTPIGELLIAGSSLGVCRICFPGEPQVEKYLWFNKHFSALPEEHADPVIERAADELQEYFERRRQSFDLPLDLRGTPFQLEVWRELTRVPYGSTISYGELARRVGKPGGARAIGSVMASNPVPIVVPCHRVVGHDSSLVGFGGGLSLKERLLELEEARIPFA